jgi:hypothetical protein
MLICGVRMSSFIAAPSGAKLITGLGFQKFPDFPRLISYPQLPSRGNAQAALNPAEVGTAK